MSATLTLETALPRILGDVSTGAGPTLLITVGLHGNEPAGVLAARRVLERLAAQRVPIPGRLLVVCGNLQALLTGDRFLDRDLNRCWSRELTSTLGEADLDTLSGEDREQAEILRVLHEATDSSGSPLHLVDLHSFSAHGPPFVILGDTLRNRRLAFPLGIPIILGLEETVPGTLLDYVVEQGHAAVVVEGGQHDLPSTVDHLEAACWSALSATGLLSEQRAEQLGGQVLHNLRATTAGLPRAVEVFHRHGLGADAHFVMRPGYENFQRVRRGEPLATDRDVEIFSPSRGLILMPLYQRQGEDGYFLARRVAMFWLWLSAVFRRAQIDRLLVPILPGVRRHPTRARTLLVDARIARWLTIEVFRLLGYRPHGQEGGRWVFTRRRDEVGAQR